MANKIKNVAWSETEPGVSFFCPGCNMRHNIPVNCERGWSFNGDLEKPTLYPSLDRKGTVPLTEEEVNFLIGGGKIEPKPLVCHSYVTDGRIQFLSDCTHHLRGQTVDLPDLKSE